MLNLDILKGEKANYLKVWIQWTKLPNSIFFSFFFLTIPRSQSSPKLFPNWRTLFSSKPKNSKLFIMKTLFCLKLKKRIRGFDWEFFALWIYPNYLFLTIPSNWSPLQDQNKCLWYFSQLSIMELFQATNSSTSPHNWNLGIIWVGYGI